jgi:prevent-host-death family protein
MPTLSSVLPASEARTNFYQILEEAGSGLRQFTISHRNKPNVVIMSAEEFEGWQETLEIMSDKKLVKSIERARKSTKTYSQEEVDKMLGW